MKKFDMIFCVLTYKNHNDLSEFVESLHDGDHNEFTYKIIVVNNYADEESLVKIRDIANSNNCDFIESDNEGYSKGNNLGIQFARSNYEYEYLVVCNPDTKIKQLNFNNLKIQKEEYIIAPEVVCLNGKIQNPMHFSYMPFSERLVYQGFKKRSKMFIYSGIILNKIARLANNLLMNLSRKKEKKIYACHGSYIIFSEKAIEKLYPVFDDNMFLFCEESDLARKAKKSDVDIIYKKDIVILHKEDGSMSLSNKNLFEIQRDSFLYYYKKWKLV